jgi:hypothetical protein
MPMLRTYLYASNNLVVSALLPAEPKNQNTATSITVLFDLRAATQCCPWSAEFYYSRFYSLYIMCLLDLPIIY